MNYVLFVMGLGIVRRIIGALIFLPSRIQGRAPASTESEEMKGPAVDETFLDELVIPLVSVPYCGVWKDQTRNRFGYWRGCG